MPVFGYLAIPVSGATDTLHHELRSLPYCQVIPADNRELLVLVTDTPDEDTEKELQNTLRGLSSLQSLSMTFGHNDEQQPENEVR
jgi:nitrate reductase NapAB chaperone NapD